ncbi:hypothetical protein FHY25_003670 [Xanthomonas arboricola]|uniref:ankyrin repeat domain-containing protein n=1 Tax=Xanthomonas campestris TaxID=339 RepID=UPI0023EA15D0|nr:hypothetical protein [Xanthomonas campestris]MCW2008968.1 hypothetical protein [Xanthomonas campestris]
MRTSIAALIALLLSGCSTVGQSSLFAESKCKAGYEYYFLNRAAAYGDLYQAELLLEGGANVDGNGYDTYLECGGGMEYSSPLMVAVFTYAHEEMTGDPKRIDRKPILEQRKEMVKLLLKYNANPNIKEGENVTPLDMAIKFNHQPTIAMLREHEAG